MNPLRKSALRRSVALALALVFYVRCVSTGETRVEALAPIEGSELNVSPPAGFTPLRVVLLEVRNSAAPGEFQVIPDGDYSGNILNRAASAAGPKTPASTGAGVGAGASPAPGPAARTSDGVRYGNEPPPAPGQSLYPPANTAAPAADAANPTAPAATDGAESTGVPAPPAVDPGAVAREVTETALFQSRRFEVVPDRLFAAEMTRLKNGGADDVSALLGAARNLNVSYILYGDLTNFEIRQERGYWKVPLWVILLVGSFFIKNDDVREAIWYAMLRAATIIPLNSPVWGYGIEWEDMELVVDIELDLRMTDAQSGSVVYTGARSVARTESVRNLNLLVWSTDNSVKIPRSSAGRQMRFAAVELVNDLSGFVDRRAQP